MKVALRVDASAAMGTGHLRRCLALAQALRGYGADAVFVSRPLGLDTAGLVAAEGFACCVLPPLPAGTADPAAGAPPHAAWAGVSAERDAQDTVELLAHAGLGVQSVVVDHYALHAPWHRHVATALQARVVAIDDLADRPLAADIVIDPNPSPDHAAKFAGRLGPGARLLGGPRFALLGPAYAGAARSVAGTTVRGIGIFMGGTDPAALSEAALRACREVLGFSGRIELVTTSANPRHRELATLAARWPNTEVVLDLPDLAAFFARHDLHIGAGGGAAWERCCIGAPSLVLSGACNQAAVVPQLARLAAAATLPEGQEPTVPAIAAALRPLLADAGLRHGLAAGARELVDGHGARRVAAALLAPWLTARAATHDDAACMHAWRNHPATRAVSLQGEAIAWPEHLAWLSRTLADPSRRLLVGQIGGHAVGVVRFDRSAACEAEVSLYLDPQLHGVGLGPHLLAAGEAAAREWAREWASDRADPGLELVATVVDGNEGSRRLFVSAGYRGTATHLRKPAARARATSLETSP